MRIKSKKAFTLLEISITVAILFILLSLGLPKFSFLNRFIVENEADRIFTVFSFLQQKAIASNCEQELYFNLQEHNYYYKNNTFNNKILEQNNNLENITKIKLPDFVNFGFIRGSKGPPSSPIKEITEAITFQNISNQNNSNKSNNNYIKVVKFYTDGKIQSGTIYLVDKDYLFMMAITCPISDVSCIRKYRYKSGKWVLVK